MKSRLLVAAVGIPVILWVILLAPMLVFELLLSLLSGIGAYELIKCVNASSDLRWGAANAAGLTVAFYAINGAEFAALLQIAYVILLLAVAVWKGGEVKWQDVATSIVCVILLPYSFTAFLRLDAMGFHRAFLLLPLLFSFASDTGAFFAGLCFGKHKLAPKVSPKKTVEGAIGGLFGNAFGGVIFALIMNSCFGYDISLCGIALLGLGCSIVAQLGDLSFSLIKREFGIKDYGKLFLAHGGVLDRFDSVLFVAPVLAVLIQWLH